MAKSTCACLCVCVSQHVRLCHKPSDPPLGLVPSTQLQQANYNRQSLPSPHAFFFFYPEAPLCPCPLPPTLLRPRLATARRNELSCRWELGGSRREGIQELRMDSLVVAKFQFVALMMMTPLISTRIHSHWRLLTFFPFSSRPKWSCSKCVYFLTTVWFNVWIHFLDFPTCAGTFCSSLKLPQDHWF